MPSLRESKKQATRRTMSDAAARILVEEGAEALTVARVAEASGVSARTFHNYFASVPEALLHFVSDVVGSVAQQVPSYDAEMTMTAIMEDITVDILSDDGVELHGVTSLFKVGEFLEASEVSCDDARSFVERCQPLVDAFMERLPDHDEFEISVMLNACGTCSMLAMRYIADQGITDTNAKKDTVRTAFKALSALK